VYNKTISIETQLSASNIHIKPMALYNSIASFINMCSVNYNTMFIFAVDDVEVNCLFEFTNINNNVQVQIKNEIEILQVQQPKVVVVQEDVTTTQTNINLCMPILQLLA
jgi:hypothetical protein